LHDPVDPFWSPPVPGKHLLIEPPVRWHVRDDTYWVADGDLIHPLGVMPLNRAQRLLVDLNDQVETDLLAAYRDLPLLTALRRHIARLGGETSS